MLLTILLLANILAIPASAHPVPDMTKTGTIDITMRHGEDLVPGGTLTIFRVGELREEDGNYRFALTEEFLKSGISLDDVQSASLPEALAEYVRQQNLEGETRNIDQNAEVRFADLELGLYLFVQFEAAEGYNLANPFVISLPRVVDGEYIYVVDGSPKMDSVTEKPTTGTTNPPATKPTGSTLPQTGQLNWPVPVLAVTGLVLVIAGMIMCSGKKMENHEI